MTRPPERGGPRYAAVKQYSLAQILALWAAAAIPMAILVWVVAPLLGNLLGGDEAFIKALLLCITAGLIWQFVLTLILTGREQETLRWSRVRDALWLRAPREPRSGRVGGRVWLWSIPAALADIILTLVLADLATKNDQSESGRAQGADRFSLIHPTS